MPVLPAYTYAAVVVGKSGRYDLVLDVDAGFGLWREGLPTRIIGPGASAQVEALGVGQRIVVATILAGGRWQARLQPDDVRPAYSYRAVLLDGHDGDNALCDADLGFGFSWRRLSVRLEGCNARELSDPGGREARENMAVVAPSGTEVLLRSLKNDKYGGRYTGVVLMPDGRSLARILIEGQWAAAWNGRGSRPLPPWPRTVL